LAIILSEELLGPNVAIIFVFLNVFFNGGNAPFLSYDLNLVICEKRGIFCRDNNIKADVFQSGWNKKTPS